MTPAALVLAEAERRITERAHELQARLDAGEDVWSAYLPVVSTLHALVPRERRDFATTKQMAERLQLTPKTIRLRKLHLDPNDRKRFEKQKISGAA